MERDLNPDQTANVVYKYADDINFLVPAYLTLVWKKRWCTLSSALTQIKWLLTGQKPMKCISTPKS